VASHPPGETVRAVPKRHGPGPRLREGVIDTRPAPPVPPGVNGR
jgi:hypothetical protein